MGKTNRSKTDVGKEEQLSKLKNKLNDQKQEILRLKRVIRELQKRIDSKGRKVNLPDEEIIEVKEEIVEEVFNTHKEKMTKFKQDFMKKIKGI